MKVWKVILVALVIFLAGGVAGGAMTRLAQRRAPSVRAPQGPPHWAAQRVELLRQMQRELQLSADQREKAHQILEESRERLNRDWRQENQRVREELRRILTPEQLAQWQEVQRARANRRPDAPARDDRRRFDPRRPHVPGTLRDNSSETNAPRPSPPPS